MELLHGSWSDSCGGAKGPSSPPSHFTTFFIYQPRRLKFGRHMVHEKCNTIICMCVGQFTSVQLILPPLHPSSPMVKSLVAPSFRMCFRVRNMNPIDIFQKSKISNSICTSKNCLNKSGRFFQTVMNLPFN